MESFNSLYTAHLPLAFQNVTGTNEALRKRVEAVLDMAVTTVSSLTESFTSGVPAFVEAGNSKDDTSHLDMAQDPLSEGKGGGRSTPEPAVKEGVAEESDDPDTELQVHD